VEAHSALANERDDAAESPPSSQSNTKLDDIPSASGIQGTSGVDAQLIRSEVATRSLDLL